MSIAKIQKSIFNGEVTVPASKSVAHRALICSFLAGGGNVEPIISSKDMAATVGIINSLKKRKLITTKGKSIVPTEKGIYLIDN